MKEISFPTCRRGTKGKRIERRRGDGECKRHKEEDQREGTHGDSEKGNQQGDKEQKT